MPSGTSRSPSSREEENVAVTRCLSFRLSEARMGADVLTWWSGFLNMVQSCNSCRSLRVERITGSHAH